MAKTVREVMTGKPVTVFPTAKLTDVARTMRDSDIGSVLVVDGGTVAGVVTDRDVVVRAVAEGRDPSSTTATEVCSRDVVCASPDDGVEDVVRVMREKAVRRMPVLDNGHPVGVVSIGDLAVENDERSALAQISAAPTNR